MMAAPSRWTEIRQEAGRALAALLVALIVAFVIVLATSEDPAGAFPIVHFSHLLVKLKCR